jgi:acetyltransferase
VTRTEVATTEDDAARIATEIGFPVVLKLHSLTVTHKTDVGGVELNLGSESEVRAAWKRIQTGVATLKGPEHFQGVSVQPMVRLKDAYELILGSSTDAQFGPVLLFGAGGQLVEVFRDRALGLPPLTSTLARRMMERTKIYKALGGVRGRAPVDHALLEQTLVSFSQLVAEQPRIKEIDINPLLASADGVLALDARVVLHDWEIDDATLPKTAIRPYPSAYVKTFTARNGSVVTIRPIRPEDEPAMVHFHETLSERSVYMRYFHHMRLSQRVAHERLTRICFVDYDREMILVAETADREIVAAGRLSRTHGTNDAEFAVLVSDPWQDQGLGTELIHTVVEVARKEKVGRIWGHILSENRSMQELARQSGFELRYSVEEGVVEASLLLFGGADLPVGAGPPGPAA